MTSLLEKVVADVRTLSAEEQERVAQVLIVFMSEGQDGEWRD